MFVIAIKDYIYVLGNLDLFFKKDRISRQNRGSILKDKDMTNYMFIKSKYKNKQ
jgi:hypothetical protein